MSKNLVIVESPAKAKTIEKYLGKDFTVKSSFGHVRDLKKKGISVDIENGFAPDYEVSADKKKIVDELTKLSKKAELVWLATDEDREGEAISWHLEEALNLKEENTRRITFNEITKSAVLHAIENPRKINRQLVDAQQARRILDRLVGFELSPVLWKKVKPSLSAGRVQSVSVRLIVEKEKDITAFESKSSYRVTALFLVDGKELSAELPKKFAERAEALKFLQDCQGADFSVAKLEVKPAKRSPAAPFTTSTLQQEASRKLGYSVSQTMVQAQKLYEGGHITYMRTDSVNLSDTALNGAREKITADYGEKYHQVRKYKSKAKGAQEAHEAIRPVDMGVKSVGDRDLDRLYQLIWKRTTASQMSDAQFERTTVHIDVSGREENLVAHGEVITFDGFMKVYLEGKDDEGDEDQKGLLPPMSEGQMLEFQSMQALQRFSKHPARYTEASLVKKLEELGIGRPSTYAPTISTIQKRGYVVKESREGHPRDLDLIILTDAVEETKKTENTGAEKNKLFPTDIGIVVNDFLVEHFEKVLSYNFTADVERQFDEIADGQLKWNTMIEQFYGPFHKTVETTLEHADRAAGERILGTDPKSGKEVIARIGRYGPMIQIGRVDDEEKPKFSSLRNEQSIGTITFDEAMKLFELPRKLGTNSEGEEISTSIGRFGPYVKFGKSFASIHKDLGLDPYTITLAEAIEVVDAKKKADKEKFIKSFPENDLRPSNKEQGMKTRLLNPAAYFNFLTFTNDPLPSAH